MAWREKIIEELLMEELTRKELARELETRYTTISQSIQAMLNNREIEEVREGEIMRQYKLRLTKEFQRRCGI